MSEALKKPSLQFSSKSVEEVPVSIGYSTEMYRKTKVDKRGLWYSSKTIIKLDGVTRMMSTMGRSSRETAFL